MDSRLKTFLPLAVSLALGALLVLLVLGIFRFSDSVTSYYTPAILNFENLMEGGEHLLLAAQGEDRRRLADSIAARHFLFALDTLAGQVRDSWPGERRREVQELLSEAVRVRESLQRGDYSQAEARLKDFLPVLAAHTREHREELERAKMGVRVLAFGVVGASLLLIAFGCVATIRERRTAELQARERQTAEALTALVSALEARESYTKGHSVRVARYCQDIAEVLGLDSRGRHKLHMAALLHDIGKIGVPDSVLLKEGRLSEEEFDVMRQHPEIGARMLSHVECLAEILPVIRHHHERHDGRGYPDGLAREDIPPLSRIISVADAYDAMTSTRPYRQALTSEEACAELREFRGRQWDAAVVDAFLSTRPEICAR